jgi:flagellin
MKGFILTAFLSLILSSVLAAQSSSIYIPGGGNFMIYNRGAQNFVIMKNKFTRSAFNAAIKKLSSGKRINSAADDPAGLAVSQKMDALMKQLSQESRNMQDMRNMFRYVEAILAQDYKILRRIRTLIVKSSNGIYGRDDREIIQSEISQLLAQIQMNARFARFNTKPVIPQLTLKGLGLQGLSVVRSPYGAAKRVDAAMKKIQRRRVLAGIKNNVLTFRIKGKEYYMVQAMSSLSRIVDQNMAEGIVNLIKNSTMLKAQHGVLLKSK